MSSEASLAASLPAHVPPASLAEFVERNQAAVCRACMAVLRRSDLVEDAAQEAFVAVLRERGLAQVLARGRAWLHRVAVNAALQVLLTPAASIEGEVGDPSGRARGRRDRGVGGGRCGAR